MKLIFKKTLLAAVIASVSGGVFADDGDINAPGAAPGVPAAARDYSQEGLALLAAGTGVSAPAISYETGAVYPAGATITFDFPDGSLAPIPGFPTTVTVSTIGMPANSTVFSIQNFDAASSTITYVSAGDTAGGTGAAVGDTFDFAVNIVQLLGSFVAENDVTVTVSSLNALVQPFDSAPGDIKTATLTDVEQQFGTFAVGTQFDEIINVTDGQNSFLGGITDTLIFNYIDNTALESNVTVTGGVLTISGDFSGLVNEHGSINDAITSTEVGAIITYDAEMERLKVSYAAAPTGNTDTIVIIPPTDEDELIKLQNQRFTATYVVKYGASSTQLAGGVSAGSWGLNGAVVNIPYLAFGENISQILYVTNEGNLDGDVIVTGFDEEGSEYHLGSVGTARAGSVTKITDEVVEGLNAAGFNSGKLSLIITVAAPEEDVTVYAAYNVGDDRIFVNTSQYKGQ